MEKEINECYKCGFYDSDFGCTCPSLDRWFACPIESEKEENKKALEEYAEWVCNNRKERAIP